MNYTTRGDASPPVRSACQRRWFALSIACQVAHFSCRLWLSFRCRLTASGGLLDPVAAARSLEAQLGLAERVLGTHGREAISTPKSRQSVRNFVPQNRYARGRLATDWYSCRNGLAAPKALPQLTSEEDRSCVWNGSPEIRTQDQSVKSRWLTPESHCYDWGGPQKFQKSFKNL